MTTDSLQLFLKDVGKVRLLTAQEEVELAKRIERGDLDLLRGGEQPTLPMSLRKSCRESVVMSGFRSSACFWRLRPRPLPASAGSASAADGFSAGSTSSTSSLPDFSRWP